MTSFDIFHDGQVFTRPIFASHSFAKDAVKHKKAPTATVGAPNKFAYFCFFTQKKLRGT